MTRRPSVALTALLTLAACEGGDAGVDGELDALRAFADLSAPTVRQLAVQGATQLPDGRAVVTQRSLVITATATDSAGVEAVCVSLDPKGCAVWQDWTGSALAELSPGEGQKYVHLWFRDGAGNVSRRPHTLSLTLDRFAPEDGLLEVNNGPGTVHLDWWGYVDRGVGIDGYVVVQALGRAPASCSEGTVIYSGPGSTLALTDLSPGQPYGWRVCGVDLLGQTSRGVIAVAESLIELDAPIVTDFSTADGETSVSNRAVELRVEAVDASGVAAMCLSEGPGCTEWTAFDPAPRFLLSDEDGEHTVHLWLEDGLGNRSAAPSLLRLMLDRAVDLDGDGSPAGVDCDDEDPTRRPGADERCNGVDDNCDGLVDAADPALHPADALRAFRDLDLDGYGDAAHPMAACALAPGLSLSDADCDDAAADRHPGALDACDGEDNDCDGDIDEQRSMFDQPMGEFGAARVVSEGLSIDGSAELSGFVVESVPSEDGIALRFNVSFTTEATFGFGWSSRDATAPERLLSGGGKNLRAVFTSETSDIIGDDAHYGGTWDFPVKAGTTLMIEVLHDDGVVDVIVDGVTRANALAAEVGDTIVFAAEGGAVVVSPPAWTCEG